MPRTRLLAALLIALAALLPRPAPALAATTIIIVTTTTDEINSDNDCSLREAIRAANLDVAVDGCAAGSGDDIIRLGAGAYRLGIEGPLDNEALAGDLDVTASLTIVGVGSHNGGTSIEGEALWNDRLLEVRGSATHLRVVDLQLRYGRGSYGGAIWNSGSLTLVRAFLHNNISDGDGGAIFSNTTSGAVTLIDSRVGPNQANNGGGIAMIQGGTLNLLGTTIAYNTATGFSFSDGGGLLVSSARLNALASTFIGNSAVELGGGLYFNSLRPANIVKSSVQENQAGQGGGVYSNGPMTVTHSALISNTASSEGGGLYRGLGVLNLSNSAISSNRANASGGGLMLAGSEAATLSSLTIATNRADHDQSGSVGDGGGLYTTGANVLLRNTIIANNVDAGSGTDYHDCRATLNSAGYNLVRDQAGCILAGTLTGNLAAGTNPILGPLANNGGPTLTNALLSGSPAVDTGNEAGCVDHLLAPLDGDQRGAARVDGDFVGSIRCDIGAYEYAGCLLLGDVNDDRSVTIADIQAIASGWNSATTLATVAHDLDYDGQITIIDIALATGEFGLSC